MTEDQRYKMNIGYISGRLDALEQVLRVTIATLTESQREFLVKAAKEYATKTREDANKTNTDPTKDRADAAWDLKENIERALEDWAPQYDESYRRK